MFCEAYASICLARADTTDTTTGKNKLAALETSRGLPFLFPAHQLALDGSAEKVGAFFLGPQNLVDAPRQGFVEAYQYVFAVQRRASHPLTITFRYR